MKKLTSLLFTFSLLLFTSLVAHAAVNQGGTEISSGTVSGKYFSGTYENSVYIVEGGANSVTFENCTFENVSANADGSCVYIDRDDGGDGCVIFRNCKFINCGNVDYDGGAICIQDIDNVSQKVIFENCIAVGCEADEGGFLYCNDKDAVINGSGSTVILDCLAIYGGGGVYTEAVNTFDGFIFADNKSADDGGGMYNNNGTDGVSTISNCRFYRNVAGDSINKYAGGGLYVRDDNGYVKNCKFFENVAYKTGAELDSNTEINNCTFTSNFGTGDEAVDGSDRVSCSFISASSYNLNNKGSGTEANPYKIENVDDWDALCYSVKSGTTYENAFLTLSADIVVASSVGIYYETDSTKRKPFKGIFDGNGHTCTFYSCSVYDDLAAFAYAVNATVRNLTVGGYIEGYRKIGGIFGDSSGSTAENCVNNATFIGSASYRGGIAGWAGDGSKFISCVNNGDITGMNDVGGIVGLSGGGSKFINCINRGSVSGKSNVGGIVGSGSGSIRNCVNAGNTHGITEAVGGIIGREEGAVTMENAHVFGAVTGVSERKAITGSSHSGSTYELCLYCKDDCPADAHGIGVSHNALWGTATDTVGGKVFKMPDYVNDYIEVNDKQKDGWLRVAFDADNQPVVVPNGLTDELGYIIGRYDETGECVFWRLGKIYKIDKDGNSTVLSSNPGVVTVDTASIGNGWFVVKGSVSRGTIKVKNMDGTANLVLLHGASLTVQGDEDQPGLFVDSTTGALAIFGVESGSLTAQGGDNGAGIGGDSMGGNGTVTIYGGTVTATGGKLGAGIGGGRDATGGTVAINGGFVVAHAGPGKSIRGLTAWDIGPGANSLVIAGSLKRGSRVFETVSGCTYREGVGVSFDVPTGFDVAEVTVDGGQCRVLKDGNRREVLVERGHSLSLTLGVTDFHYRIAGQTGVTLGPFGPMFEDRRLYETQVPSSEKVVTPIACPYVLANGQVVNGNALPLCSTSFATSLNGEEGWYVVTGSATAGVFVVQGEVSLILADGAKLTVEGGIRVEGGNALNIYGQSAGTGSLVANGADECAGIGGQNLSRWGGFGNCGTVTINGGTVTATGGEASAGIGGGYYGGGGVITINGGTVTVQGGEWGAGIGGGQDGAGGIVTINGGTVMATGGSDASWGRYGGAGISGGGGSAGGTVKINGGTVTARGQNGGKGIGRGGSGNSDGSLELGKNVNVISGQVSSDYVKIGILTCEGGAVEQGDGAWVVTPSADSTEVKIGNLPDGAKVAVPPTVTQVKGVADNQIIVKFGAYDITGAFTVSGGALALDPAGEVNGVKVTPTIGELSEDEGEPFVVGEGGAAVTVKAIPGLKYELRRAGSLSAPVREDADGTVWDAVGEPVVATGTAVTLEDGDPPEGQAFYTIGVSVP